MENPENTQNNDQNAPQNAPEAPEMAQTPEPEHKRFGKKSKSENALLAANTKIAELTTDLQRTRADFENYRKQMEISRANSMEIARQDTVKKVLPLIDDMDRAIAANPELSPLAKNLEKTIKELGLERIDSNAGTEFNPELHNAITMEEGEGDTEVIAESLMAGYTYDGSVIRPAMVKVTTK